ncbi:hypothetical protein JRQ81_018874 [Phrynocephalus forsythii]|uniref:SAP domain-containing protein n=1 Tax=Phrynocephalus forsythii TaxID=171643 RepID=A0A9Q0XRS4_9SAUR|nr:hypothetical protein JRQ81_018874 [Phrynocephalus forsythii]
MPRLARKMAKSASTPPLRKPAKGSACPSASETSSVDYSSLKRAQLQQQCKKLGIRATGKTTELVERLKTFHAKPLLKMVNSKEEKIVKAEEDCQNHEATGTVPPLDLTKDVKTETFEEKTDMIRGWCVVHGMVLYRPASSWAPLLLRGGLVCVQDGNNVVPFHIPPLNISVPEGLSDNYVCEDCVLRNREKPKRCLLCQQMPGKGNQAYLSQNFLKSLTPPQSNPSELSFLATNGSKDKRRTTEIRKLYQPQEDQAYAQRVDGILSQMARGELGMDRALRPLQPLVVHSPAPYER